jgi:hypothetical protein
VSTWQDLVTASLIGTERTGVPGTGVPGLPGPAGARPDSPGPDDPAALLLDRAALLTVARRGGRPAGHAEPPPEAEPDPAPAVSPAAGRRLARMLGGEHPDLLAEWLAAAVARDRRAPAGLLPALLDRARRVSPSDPELRRLAAEAGGSRARWLAGLNPDWTFVTAHAGAGQDAWRLGGKSQRRGYLAALRTRDPGAARELITASWEAAAGPERVMFLSVMANTGLSLADEPLLEAALDELDAEVRGWAAYLLARLPASALGQRMAQRALDCIRIESGVRGTRLVVVPPARSDAAMRRDGVTSGQGGRLPERDARTHLLHEVLARTPLRTWTGRFGRTAEQILAVPSGPWAPVLFTGWSRAAMAQRDQEWMTALINWALGGAPTGTVFGAETLRQLARRVDPARCALQATADRGAEIPPPIRDAIGVLCFRYDMLKELEL